MKKEKTRTRPILLTACSFFLIITGVLLFEGATVKSFALTDADCRACHTGGLYPSVAERHHSLYVPVEFECINCHNADTPLSCTVCHVDAGHQPDHNNTGVPSQECSSCHSANVYDEHITNRTLDCSVCHQSARQEVLDAITQGSGPTGQTVLCGACHANAGMHEADHDNTLVDSADCSQCHTDNVFTEHVVNRGWSCGTCHQGETLTLDPVLVQQVITDASGPSPLTTAYCTSCHGAEAGSHVAAHDQGLFSEIPTGQDCSRCHALMQPSVDPNQANLVEEHVTNRGLTCSTCHDRTDHVFDAIDKGRGPSNLPVYCIDCHTDATSGQGLGHSPITAEPWSECSWCHTIDVFGIDEHSMHQAAAQDMQQDCSVCHVPEGSRPDCIMCHSLDQTIWDPLPIHRTEPNSSLNIKGPGTEDHDRHTSGIDCSYCHVSGIPGSEPLPAPFTECSRCHSTNGPGTDISYGSVVHTTSHIQGAEALNKGCAYCHSQTPACNDCHQIAGPNKPQHDTHTDTLNYNCTECHTGGIAGSEPLPEPYDQCSKCHSSTGPGSDIIYGSVIHTDNHIAGGETTPIGCDLCHSTVEPAPYCTICHQIAGPNMTTHDNHTNTMGYNCSVCHVSGVPGDTPIPPPYDGCSSCHDGTGNTTSILYGQPGHNTHMSQANNNCSLCHTAQPDCSSCHAPGHQPIPAPYDICATCHNGTGTTKNILFGQPGHDAHMTAATNCTVCHTDQPDCASCHAPGHQPIPAPYDTCSSCHENIQPGSVTHTTHRARTNQDCTVCHTPQPNCGQCHTGELHEPVPAPFNACDQCHISIQPGSVTHEAHKTQATSNGSIDCTVCHSVQATCTSCHEPGHAPVPETFMACSSCHTTIAYGQAVHNTHIDEARTATGNNCVTCHSAQATCATCHSPGHPEIPAPYNTCSTCHETIQPGSLTHDTHKNQASQDCTVCHTPQPNCGQCHTGELHEPIPAPYNTCDQCHTTLQPGDATHDAHKIAATSGGIVNCSVCHTSSPAPDCSQCHTAGNHEASHDSVGVPSAGCTNCHDENVVVEHVTNRTFTCATCHESTDQNVINAISSGQAGVFVSCYDCHGQNNHHATAEAQSGNCTQCHADPRPMDNDPQQLACRECHIDNNGYVKTSTGKPSHAFNTNGNIQDFGACFSCHAPEPYHARPTSWPGWYEENQQAPGRGIFNVFKNELQPNCAGDCEGSLENRSGYGEDSQPERNNDNNWRYPANFNWFQVDYQGQAMNVPVFDQGQAMPSHPHDRINAVGNCGNCHTVGTVVPVTHNNDCQGCHLSNNTTVQEVISMGRSGSSVDCFDCHGSQDHETAHDMTELTEPNCVECHVPNVFTEHVANRTLTCADCHSSTDSNVQGAIARGMSGAPVPCQDCHGPSAGDHLDAHDNAGVPSTGCTNCHDANVVTEHVTNRTFTCATCHDSGDPNVYNAINFGRSGTFVTCYNCHGQAGAAHHDNDNARTGTCTYCHADPRLDVDPNAPTGQLACRQCHMDNNGYVSVGSGKPSHAFNTSGSIQDFGACFDCHQPTPYHAKPTQQPSDCNAGTDEAPGKGSFNLFSSEYGGQDGWRSGNGRGRDSERCDGRNSDYRDPAISFSMVTIVDQLGTNRQYSVPTFGSSGGGGGGGTQNDSVNITYASYSSRGDRLTVYAENSLGNDATLTVMYYGEEYQMSWDSSDDRWEIRINASRCRDSSIEVESSAGGTDTSTVSNCSGW